MNDAYVPTTLFNKIFPSIVDGTTNSVPSSSSSSQQHDSLLPLNNETRSTTTTNNNNYYVYLQVGPNNNVGTLLRLVPAVFVVQGDTNSATLKDAQDTTTAVVQIQALLLRVLLQSCGHVNSHYDGGDDTNENEDVSRSTVESQNFKVSLSSHGNYCSIFDNVHSFSSSSSIGVRSQGWLEKVTIQDFNKLKINNTVVGGSASSNENNQHEVKIHLRYMCSSSSHCREYFTNGISNNFNSYSLHQRKQRTITFLSTKMAGQVITNGGIFCLDFGGGDNDNNNSIANNTNDCGGGNNDNQEQAFFFVERIILSAVAQNNNMATVSPKDEDQRKIRNCIRLGECGSFEIVSLTLPNDVVTTSSTTNDGDKVDNAHGFDTRNNNGTSRNNNILINNNYYDCNPQGEDIHYSCPGYEPVLDELLTLAKITDPNGSPTAVVLSGCSGVGKTRMASWFEKELPRVFSSSIHVSSISVKDILLEVASPLFDEDGILQRVVQSNNSSQQHRSRGVTHSSSIDSLLIIDDMDVIVDSANEADSNATTNTGLESEQQRALHSIVKLVDSAINNSIHRYFVLGISRASWAQLPLQLARVGRFEKVVTMPPPTLDQRKNIFKFWISTLPLDIGSETENDAVIAQWAGLLAPRTAGCVAADIRRICADALTRAVARMSKPNQSHTISENYQENVVLGSRSAVKWDDIREAARMCVPSQLSSLDVIPATLQEFSGDKEQIIDTKKEFELAWKNFGGYDAEKKRLYRTVVRPWKHHMGIAYASNNTQSSSVNATLDVSRPSGVIFYGPSGCGKTFAAMCLASSLGLHCVKVRASEVFNQWLGGSEATLRSIFSRARAASPCILFFDELDSLAMNREADDSDATSGVQSRILTTLLNEMDGITNAGGKQGVLVVAATNRLEAIDAALLRPGRLEEHVKLPLPNASCIAEILKIQSAKMPLENSLDFDRLGSLMTSVSCAEAEGICRDACLIAMRNCSERGILDAVSVSSQDFVDAFQRLKKNTSSSKN